MRSVRFLNTAAVAPLVVSLMLAACSGSSDSTAPNIDLVWSTVPNGSTQQLMGVWGTSSSDVWAGGQLGTILHYNGTTWSTFTNPATDYLYSAWGASPSDVWIVGRRGQTLRYNGTAWSAVASGMTGDLFGVWGTSA